jgi:S1-C subfamily serine protease
VSELLAPPPAVPTCPSCGAAVEGNAAFCGHCGASVGSVTTKQSQPAAVSGSSGRRFHLWPAVAVAIGVMGIAVAVVALLLNDSERSARSRAVAADRAQIRELGNELQALQASNAALAGKVSSTAKKVNASQAGVAPLAARMLRSVFTVQTEFGLGTGWAAWTDGGNTYLITANHVAQDAISAGTHDVKLKQKGRMWNGTIVRTDSTNDLAVIRVPGEIAPALWQTPDDTLSPQPGDTLLLVGSPYGLEGTVTTGIVSRVTYDEIQTDAAANPGNSGGPAVDSKGNVVGVLLAGGGENLNFLVPIQRACVSVRSC